MPQYSIWAKRMTTQTTPYDSPETQYSNAKTLGEIPTGHPLRRHQIEVE